MGRGLDTGSISCPTGLVSSWIDVDGLSLFQACGLVWRRVFVNRRLHAEGGRGRELITGMNRNELSRPRHRASCRSAVKSKQQIVERVQESIGDAPDVARHYVEYHRTTRAVLLSHLHRYSVLPLDMAAYRFRKDQNEWRVLPRRIEEGI